MNALKFASKATAFVIVATCLGAIAFVPDPVDADAVTGSAASLDLASSAVCVAPLATTGGAPQRLEENECPPTSTRTIGGQEVEGSLYDVDCIGVSIGIWYVGSVSCESCNCIYMAQFNRYHWTWHDSRGGCDAESSVWVT